MTPRAALRTPQKGAIESTHPRADCHALLQLLSENPEAGANELVRCFSREVNRLVRRVLGPDPDHSDLVQQIFCKLFTRWRSVQQPARLPGWVQAVTLNTVYEELRKREVRKSCLREIELTTPHRNLALDVEARDLLSTTLAILERLPVKQRTAFNLRYVEGASIKHVADQCGVSVRTIKRRLRAATQQLQQHLASYPDLLTRLNERNKPQSDDHAR